MKLKFTNLDGDEHTVNTELRGIEGNIDLHEVTSKACYEMWGMDEVVYNTWIGTDIRGNIVYSFDEFHGLTKKRVYDENDKVIHY